MMKALMNVLLCFSLLGTRAPDGLAQQTALDQEHIRRLIQSLPDDSRLRHYLEAGHHGNGVHYPWMDDMLRLDVKHVVFFVERKGRRKLRNIKIVHIVYFSDFDGNCSQITDPERLSRIQGSGLEAKLLEVATQRGLVEPILSMHGTHRWDASGVVKLYANERVPYVSGLAPGANSQTPFEQAIGMNDLVELMRILQAGVTSDQLDSAMWMTDYVDNSCMMKALLKAGGNVNHTDSEGRTILMEAVRYNSLRVARVLLAAGANPNARSSRNESVLSLALAEHNDAMVSLLKSAGARN